MLLSPACCGFIFADSVVSNACGVGYIRNFCFVPLQISEGRADVPVRIGKGIVQIEARRTDKGPIVAIAARNRWKARWLAYIPLIFSFDLLLAGRCAPASPAAATPQQVFCKRGTGRRSRPHRKGHRSERGKKARQGPQRCKRRPQSHNQSGYYRTIIHQASMSSEIRWLSEG